jgi:oligopeptide/dipeptide ABC transporter ATP-binding protein
LLESGMSGRTKALDPPFLEAKDLTKHFPLKGGGVIHALNGVSLAQTKGETIGIVGESGCGKSTLARAILRLIEPDAGSVHFMGEDLLQLSKPAMRAKRREMQIIFQDPFASLDPRFKIGDAIEEPLLIHGIGSKAERRAKVRDLLDMVGLGHETAARYPHEFSGGQRQRIGIARALAAAPKLVIADEPVSALDVSIQSQILNLLVELRERLDLSFLFISHDLAVVRYISDRIAVMYLGEIVELGMAETIYKEAAHPYTQALISAIPEPIPGRRQQRIILSGDVPNPESPPPGCPFHPRCPHAMDVCRVQTPRETQLGTEPGVHSARCHLHG